jgi:acetyl/propionyl-CoA carboxylase alpha subunit/acetyl-CoA carboxylase carboxyltransferase component
VGTVPYLIVNERGRPVSGEGWRVAVVNRGEAAIRFLNAAREFSEEEGVPIETVAFYTEPDRNAAFVRRADRSVSLTRVGAAALPAHQAYLSLPVLEQALVESAVDAVWPGWGFVSENPDFVRLCERLGITFIGPPAEAIALLGDKMSAKTLAESVGVPVAPWSGGPVDSLDEAMQQAGRIGYPLMLKAAAGGGGRGIRAVESAADLSGMFRESRREAASAFGDERVFLEALVAGGRHVEVQVAADGSGTVWALGLRDCSVQRRRQKVLEESSPPHMPPEVASAIQDAATRLCRAAGYRNLGTVEFLYEPRFNSFAFMEMNTRLQVEHAVTELVAQVDLVKLQLSIARNGRLSDAVPTSRGHAIEVRLNAEDPSRGLTPSPGKLLELQFPAGPGIRVDSGVEVGDEIPSEFDSLIAKILAVGRTREEALSRLNRALESTRVVVEGGATNRSLLLFLAGHPEIREGGVDITWLDRTMESTRFDDGPEAGLAVIQSAIEECQTDYETATATFQRDAASERISAGLDSSRRYELSHAGADYMVDVRRVGPEQFLVSVDGTDLPVHVRSFGRYHRQIDLGSDQLSCLVWRAGPALVVEIGPRLYRVVSGEQGLVRATSGSVVVAVRVREGEPVAAGQIVLTTEAMKMESPVVAPFAGTVREVAVGAGQQVHAGEVLLRIDRQAEDTGSSGSRIDFSDWSSGAGEWVPDAWEDAQCLALGYDSLRSLDQLMIDLPATANQDGLSQDQLSRRLELLDLLADQLDLLRDPTSDESGDQRRWGSLLRFVGASADPWNDESDLVAARLRQMLCRYGIEGPEPSQVTAALFHIARAQSRLADLARLAAAVLEPWLRLPPVVPGSEQRLEAVLHKLVEAAAGSLAHVADLARAVAHQAIEHPALAARHGELVTRVRSVLKSVVETDGVGILGPLIDLDDAVLPVLMAVAADSQARIAAAALEVIVRRFHRQRRFDRCVQVGLSSATAVRLPESGQSHAGVVALVVTATESEIGTTIESEFASEGWTSGWVELIFAGVVDESEVANLLDTAVARTTAPADLMVTATWLDRSGAVLHESVQRQSGEVVTTSADGGLHPSAAERMELWRLEHFELARMPAPVGIQLLRAVARTNPADERLFALVEVFDLSQLEKVLHQSAIAIRRARYELHDSGRALNNRIVVYVQPIWDIKLSRLREMFARLTPSTRGLGIERVLLRARRPEPPGTGTIEDVIHISPPREPGLMIGYARPSASAVRPLSTYRQRVIELARRGLTHPYEIVTMLVSPGASHSDFPAGEFDEHDLDHTGVLRPVKRPVGFNEARVVVGLITNRSAAHPQGLRRVLVLNDPSEDLGSLAEPECRRIIAALDLAADLGIPVDWFAVSSGALIAMDSGTENLDWTAAVLRRIVTFTQDGGTINVVVSGINVGAQSYFDAEATMLMHTKGLLVMVGSHPMVLTGKQALEFSGGVSADDNESIGGYRRIAGPNGQGQSWAPDLVAACGLLFRHHEATGERGRRMDSSDSPDRDIRTHPHSHPDSPFRRVGDIFSDRLNPERKLPFDIRTVMAAIADQDCVPFERWPDWTDARNVIIEDVRLGGHRVMLAGIESRNLRRTGPASGDGPDMWMAGTLFPQSSKKLARALNAASGNRPVIILANLSGFDGSPESMRALQLEYGAEIARAVVNFEGRLIFCILTRCHGGAFVVFSQALNPQLEVIALEGSWASVLGGVPAAAVVFGREVSNRVRSDPRWRKLDSELRASPSELAPEVEARLSDLERRLTLEMRAVVAGEFDGIHTVQRARSVGSVDRIVPARDLRLDLIRAIERSR